MKCDWLSRDVLFFWKRLESVDNFQDPPGLARLQEGKTRQKINLLAVHLDRQKQGHP
jgi:hypothetical protein